MQGPKWEGAVSSNELRALKWWAAVRARWTRLPCTNALCELTALYDPQSIA